MEARVRIELTIEDLQSSALPLGDRAITRSLREKRRRMQTRSSEFFSEVQILYFFYSQSVFGSNGSRYKLTAALDGNIDAIIVYATKQTVQRRFRILSRSTKYNLGQWRLQRSTRRRPLPRRFSLPVNHHSGVQPRADQQEHRAGTEFAY